MTEVWHRYEDGEVSVEFLGFRQSAFLRHIELPVLKHTPCGVWIGYSIHSKRFVLTKARKRYACPTQAEALESFIKRKERQCGILKAQLERAQAMLAAAKEESINNAN